MSLIEVRQESSAGVTIWDLQTHHCRWIIEETKDGAIFCGCQKVRGLSYCEPHARRVYMHIPSAIARHTAGRDQ